MKPPNKKSTKRPPRRRARNPAKSRAYARTAARRDSDYLKAVERTLTEWTSPEDEAAWRNL